jgi:dimethylsulfone monooxygenase
VAVPSICPYKLCPPFSIPTLAERIVELKAVGVDLILSGFLHFIEEVEYFGAKVLPLVRELEAQQQSVETAKSA